MAETGGHYSVSDRADEIEVMQAASIGGLVLDLGGLAVRSLS
jgi:hypothetical protein